MAAPLASEELLRRALSLAEARRPDPTGLGREAYLDEAEALVRRAARWQDDEGRILDPWHGAEDCYDTGRFVGALGGLVGAGRCLDLLANLDAGVRRLARFYRWQMTGSGPSLAAEFFSKEIGWALWHGRDRLAADTVAFAEETLAEADPDTVYVDTLGHHDAGQLFNFNTFSLAGEQLLRALGLRSGGDYVERHLPHHMPRFTEAGLYCDADAAVVYDWVPRVNLSTMLWAGYDGPMARQVGEVLRRGALTQLLLHNPHGLGWFGGRSNQYQFNEMQLAVICEYEAGRWAEEDPVLAGMFRRAARLALKGILPWLRLDPPRHMKNAFHPAVGWGFDSYGSYAVYLMLAASLMTFAYHFAEAEIEERPLPAEVMTYAVDLGPRFRKAFAHRAGVSLQWDLRGAGGYDATGLGRVLWGEAPLELGLLAPLPGRPSYLLPSWLRPEGEEVGRGVQALKPAAVSCAWKETEDGPWVRLAELQPEGYEFAWEDEGEKLRARVTWQGDEGRVEGIFAVSDAGLEVVWRVPGAWRVRQEWPLLVTDGRSDCEPAADEQAGALVLRLGEWELRVQGQEGARAALEEGVAANRNGLYRLGTLAAEGDSVRAVARAVRRT